jgi:hypothetical protein
MSLVFLIEDSSENFQKMVRYAQEFKPLVLNTEGWQEDEEFDALSEAIEMFEDKELLLIKCSGRESIITALGDNYPEMILILSCNRTSKHYTENTLGVFRDLLNIFVKETIDGTITIAQSAT